MIQTGKVVSLSYHLKNKKGETLDQSTDGDPLVYMHGKSQIIPGLEEALVGLEAGAKKKVEVTPENGYGPLVEELRVKVKKTQFPPDMAVTLGMQVQSQSPDGQAMVFVVTAIDADEISLDGNHPMAGQTLFFDVEVLSVRDATKDELSHGHAHGPDGHHHH